MTATTAGSTTHPTRRAGRAIVIAGAVLAPLVLWTSSRILGIDLEVVMPGQEPMLLGLPFVAATALLASLAGWGSFALLRRLTVRARGIWTALATTALLVSFIPVLVAQTSTSARIMLALMHVAVAAVLVPGLRHTEERS